MERAELRALGIDTALIFSASTQTAFQTATQGPKPTMAAHGGDTAGGTAQIQGKRVIDEIEAAYLADDIVNRKRCDDLSLVLDGADISDKALKMLVKALKAARITNRVTLSMKQCDLEGERLAIVADLLQSIPCSVALDLRNNKIGQREARILRRALVQRGTLQGRQGRHLGEVILNLESNNIGDKAAVELAQSLSAVVYNLRLWLCHNDIGHEGGKAIARILYRRTSVHKIKVDLWGNPLSDEALVALHVAKQKPFNHIFHVRLYDGAVVGVQTASDAEYRLLLMRFKDLEDQGQGTLKRSEEAGVPAMIFQFASDADDRACRGLVIVCQRLRESSEYVARASLLMARGYGNKNLAPRVVIHGGACKPTALTRPGDLVLLRGVANSNYGTVTGDAFIPKASDTWNPQTRTHEPRYFVPCDETLAVIANRAFSNFRNASEYRRINKQLGRNPTLQHGCGIAGNIAWDTEWNTRVNNALRKKIEPDVFDNGEFVNTDAQVATAARVFFEKNIPYTSVHVAAQPGQKPLPEISTSFLWFWLDEIAKHQKKG